MQENRPLTNFGSRFTVLGLLCMAMISGAIMEPSPFRTQQKKFSRVKQAYLNCEKTVKQLFDTAGIDYTRFHLALVASKEDKQLKVFAANRATDAFTHITTYDFCVLSGSLGPKRKEGDLQVPEGLYHISKFNPVSNFHLSLKVNYPNASDRILSDRQQPGGEIYIHGNCVSVGCIPVTDEKIEELYIMCVEATAHGQPQIPVYIFPFEMTKERLDARLNFFPPDSVRNAFWNNLQPGFQQWNKFRKPLKYTVNKQGQYVFR